MKKLSKDLQKEIANGNHGALMQGIEDLFDMYNNSPWEDGYNACLDDIQVHSKRLVDHIFEEHNVPDTSGMIHLVTSRYRLTKIIETYLDAELNKK
jgi:hypothetical protein